MLEKNCFLIFKFVSEKLYFFKDLQFYSILCFVSVVAWGHELITFIEWW